MPEPGFAAKKIPIGGNAEPKNECVVFYKRLLDMVDGGSVFAQSGIDKCSENGTHTLGRAAIFQP